MTGDPVERVRTSIEKAREWGYDLLDSAAEPEDPWPRMNVISARGVVSWVRRVIHRVYRALHIEPRS